jgi:iron complex outermembrane receptor protein
VTSFTEIGFSRVEREYTGAPKTIASTTPTTVFRVNGLPTSYQLLLPSGHPDNPFTGYKAAAAFRFTGTDAGSETVNKTYRFLTGLKGTTGAFDWETGFLYNRAERDDLGHGYLYFPVINRIVTENRTIAATLADPNAVRDVDNTGFSQVMQLDAKASTTVGKLPGGDIGVAFGAEVRQEKLGLTSDPELASGNIIGLSNSVLAGQRMVKSGFVELRTPFTKTFEMDFAGRVDKYPTARSFVPKVGAKWEATDKVTFRGSFGRPYPGGRRRSAGLLARHLVGVGSEPGPEERNLEELLVRRDHQPDQERRPADRLLPYPQGKRDRAAVVDLRGPAPGPVPGPGRA